MAFALFAQMSLKASSSAFSVSKKRAGGMSPCVDKISVLAASTVEGWVALSGATAVAIFSLVDAGSDSAFDVIVLDSVVLKPVLLAIEPFKVMCQCQSGGEKGSHRVLFWKIDVHERCTPLSVRALSTYF